jgi:hypothetical protein
LYAIRAREFSDLVARLGQHNTIKPELLRLIREIKKRQALCISSGEIVDRYIAGEAPGVPFSVPSYTVAELEKEMNERKQKAFTAAERYREVAEEFCALTGQAHDGGLSHPDSVETVRTATKNIKDALEQYRTAMAQLFDLLTNDTP